MDIKEVDALIETALAEVAAAADLAALEAVRVKYISRNGMLPELMKGLKDVPNEGKREMGQALNRFKVAVTTGINERKVALESSTKSSKSDSFDLSLPGRWILFICRAGCCCGHRLLRCRRAIWKAASRRYALCVRGGATAGTRPMRRTALISTRLRVSMWMSRSAWLI